LGDFVPFSRSFNAALKRRQRQKTTSLTLLI
jgi:hypothetical protein